MNTPEDLFRDSFNGFEQEPSSKVWQNIQRRLMWNDFLKFNPKSFNVWYLAAAVVAVGFFAVKFPETEKIIVSPISKSRYEYSASKRKVLIINEKTSSPKKSENELPRITPQNSNVVSNDTNKHISDTFLSQNSGMEKISGGQSDEIEIPDFSSSFQMSSSSGCAPFTVEFKNLSKNTEYCYWNFGNGEVSYDTDGKATYLKPGQYYVTLKTVNGTFSKVYSDTVTVYEQPKAEIAYVFSSKTLVAEARNSETPALSWDFGDGKKSVGAKVTHTYADYGVYRLKLLVNNNICADTITADIKIQPQEYSIKFPNALTTLAPFSPKGDLDKISHYSLKILSRNGKEVFFTSDINQGWNGYYKGERVQKGVYIYKCKYEFLNGERGNLTGNITVLWDTENY